ncbi:acyl-CoA dehydrogenase family protein [Nocardioides sp. NPDC006273]|uniref:acyl-CoA dehydrogenase family protein n=1 Tax=Nocardioides sp. NPDC006273 TaxID=3155598 RepID=UPI0033A81D57
MRFALTEEQSDLVATVRTLVAKRATSMDLRAAMVTPEGYDTTLWQTLIAQIGVAALAIPEEYDGAGCTYLEAHLVLEELGAGLTPSPLLGVLLATEALLIGGSDEAKRRLLPQIAAGTTAALVLDADLVLDAPDAEIVLALDGDELLEVTDAEITPVDGLDQTLRFGRVRYDRAKATSVGTADPSSIDAVGATAMTALQAGAAARALEITVAYLKERHQFGRPLGSFQALKHRCADMLVQTETARTMSWAAAWSVGQPDQCVRASAAKSWCSDAFSQVAAEMVQLHGGVAITWEHDAHLYFKRAHATAQLFGRAAEHRRAAAIDPTTIEGAR